MKYFLKAMAVALPAVFGMLLPLTSFAGPVHAQTEDAGEKQRQLSGLIKEALPASRLPEIYDDIRRAMRDAYLPTIRRAERGDLPGAQTQDAATLEKLGKVAAFLDYALRAAEEAEPFLAANGDAIIGDYAKLMANYLTGPEIEAARELFEMPAIRKVFNVVYAASRLVTGYTAKEIDDYYAMSAWIKDLEFKFGGGDNYLAQPDAPVAPPSPGQVVKAQSIIEDFLRVARLDEMVTRITQFVRDVQLQADVLPEEEREQIRARLEQFEFIYNLQKSMVVAIGPSVLAAALNQEQLEKLHLLVLSPAMGKTFGMLDNVVREATSFTKTDIRALQSFSETVEKKGLFQERDAAQKERFEAEAEALTKSWRERLMLSLTPATREGLERSIAELEALKPNEGNGDGDGDDDQDDAVPDAPPAGQRI